MIDFSSLMNAMERHFQRRLFAIVIIIAVCLSQEMEHSSTLENNDNNNNNNNIKGHQEPFGQSGSTSKVTEVSGLLASSSNFFQDFFLASKPVLLKGAAKSSPAFTKWTDSYLSQVAAQPENSRLYLQVETQKKESRQQEVKEMTLAEFLNVYNDSELYVVDEVPVFLEPDLTMPCVLQCPDLEMVRMAKMMWYSGGGTKSVVHTDSYDNINCLFRGNKSLVLMDPSTISIGSLLDRPEGTYSDIDVDRVDLYRYPSLRGARFQIADMEEGDCLYIPYLWIHQVRSFNSNLAVNFWLDHYEVLFLLQSDHCKEDNGLHCDPKSTLDLWLNPPSLQSDAVTSADLKTDKDFFLILFQYGAYHADRLLNDKGQGDIEQKVKIDTLMDVVETYIFPDLKQTSSDVASDARQNVREAMAIADEDEDGVLSVSEFERGHGATWEAIVELMAALYGRPIETSPISSSGSIETTTESANSENVDGEIVEGRKEWESVNEEKFIGNDEL